MSGTTILQQGLTTTCKDPRISFVESDGRSLVGRMSPYERRRRGNALPGRARRDPDRTVTPGVRQRGSGHLAVSGAGNWITGSNRISETSVRGQPTLSGADVSQHLNLIPVGKACTGEPRSEPNGTRIFVTLLKNEGCVVNIRIDSSSLVLSRSVDLGAWKVPPQSSELGYFGDTRRK